MLQYKVLRLPFWEQSDIYHSGRALRNPNTYPAQDRSPFCILDFVNEMWQHLHLLHTFAVGNHCVIFLGRLKNIIQSPFLKATANILGKNLKKWSQNGPLSCYEGHDIKTSWYLLIHKDLVFSRSRFLWRNLDLDNCINLSNGYFLIDIN